MKFKVGDKVKHKVYHKDFGVGEIVYINEGESGMNYAVMFEIFNENLHCLGIYGAPMVKSGHGWWCKECDLELDKQQSYNLIPQIAKMLGVEIGEEFKVRNNNEYVYMFDELLLYRRFIDQPFSVDYVGFNQLLNGELVIQKLPTEDEKAILRNLPKQYKWIVRDNSGELYVYETKPKKGDNRWIIFGSDYFNDLNMFQSLFQFIKWEDKEPYNIEELLKGE